MNTLSSLLNFIGNYISKLKGEQVRANNIWVSGNGRVVVNIPNSGRGIVFLSAGIKDIIIYSANSQGTVTIRTTALDSSNYTLSLDTNKLIIQSNTNSGTGVTAMNLNPGGAPPTFN